MDGPLDSQTSPLNVVVIVIDALRAGSLGCYGGPQDASPVLDRLATQGVLFEDAFCTWNTTDQSLTTILTGKYPVSHGIVRHGDAVTEEELETFAGTGTTLLSEMLHEAGYATLAVDWMGRWFRRGFDYYGYPPLPDLLTRIRLYARYMWQHLDIFRCYAGQPGESDGSLLEDIRGVLSTFLFTHQLAEIQDAARMTNAGLQVLDEHGADPFFLFLHYWDVHTPYNAPRRFRRYRGTDPEKQLSDRYAGAVRYVDEQIGRLVKGLRRRGQMENTLLVITSDHGESHTEHGIYFDHHGLYDATTHVPLILHCPARLPTSRRLSGFVQHVDLVPTILQMTGIEDERRALDGASLLPMIRGRAEEVRPCVYCEESYVQEKRALRNRRYKYITAVDGDGYCRYCHKVHGGVEELYDLREDPGETRNVVDDRRDVAARMRQELEDIVTGLRQRRDSNMGASGGRTAAPLSEEEREELRGRFRSLGYHG